MNHALADRASHVCKSAALWWEGRRALPCKRRRRRTRPVPGGGPFESVVGLCYFELARRFRARARKAVAFAAAPISS